MEHIIFTFDAEQFYENYAVSQDKELVIFAGPTHGITPCTIALAAHSPIESPITGTICLTGSRLDLEPAACLSTKILDVLMRTAVPQL